MDNDLWNYPETVGRLDVTGFEVEALIELRDAGVVGLCEAVGVLFLVGPAVLLVGLVVLDEDPVGEEEDLVAFGELQLPADHQRLAAPEPPNLERVDGRPPACIDHPPNAEA